MTMGRTAVKCPAILALYFVYMGLLYPIFAHEVLEITAKGKVGSSANISCVVSPETVNIAWLYQGDPIKRDDRITDATEIVLGGKDNDGSTMKSKKSTLIIANATAKDAGNYTCVSSLGGDKLQLPVTLELSFNASLVNKTSSPIHRNVSQSVNLECIFEAYNTSNATEVKWYKKGHPQEYVSDVPKQLDARRVASNHTVHITSADDDGIRICELEDSVSSNRVSGEIEILVHDKPTVHIEKVIPISTTELYLNWTVKTYHSEVESYFLYNSTVFPNGSSSNYDLYPKRIGPTNTSFVMTGLKKSTKYKVKLEVKTPYGANKNIYVPIMETLEKDPIFVPNISINGFSATSVTIGWAPPPKEIEEYIHYYLLEARKKHENGSKKAYHSRDSRNLPYMFDNLEPHSTYVFQVCACSDYTKKCGNWSDEMEAATLDGIPDKPSNVRVECTRSYLNLSWDKPLKPKAEIKGYTMELTGNATFKDRFGKQVPATWGPLSKFTVNDSRYAKFDDLQPNTNYTVRLSAMTRTRRRGEEEVKYCKTDPAPPDQPLRPRWRKIIENDKYMFKMYLPRISERNGPICCYRIYMVRLPPSEWKNLLSPKDIPVMEFKVAHGQPPQLGAYMTDVFSNENFPPESELVMGDQKTYFDKNDTVLKSDACRRCLVRPKRLTPVVTTSSTTTTTQQTTTVDDLLVEDSNNDINDMGTEDPDTSATETSASETHTGKVKRSHGYSDFSDNPTMLDKLVYEDQELKLEDGPLDPSTNYTLFVELITGIENEPHIYSDCVNVLMPAPTPVAPQPGSVIEIALQATCAIAALVLLLMIVFCIRQTRRSRKMPPHAHLELNPLQMAYRYMAGFRGRPQAVPTAPPDMPPIPKDDLADAYAERQADSDYGFQKEFEMLPECFPDRSTHASEARENQPKNRYPDIKAYDQTRVKLSQIDGITGSDYINANYVMGYQERKQFICAQGPTDTTVNDFWRMIWEHGLELIVMLTNLEEYSKVKCSKYWPDEIRGSRAFGNITVHHVSEKRYSDYIVRELKITKQPTNSDGQPIVENNGIAKRNGDCKDHSDGSAPTSPREVKDVDARVVKQYHFLMWKDFAAPEHAYSILKFIKRVNEAWSNMVGRPAVVHCSAGVGRTGTLVALDCLLEQLKETGHVAVFNTVAELRRQRNFLVQSLKQYVFVYRALVEYAHYGDTEIPACRLKGSIDRLRNTPPGAASCLMEIEFEKILNTPIPEPLKSCAAGAAEELRAKNRSQDVLPYDRNRVILAPIPARDFSTYINASFIEAYDNSESFIITQDPLPNTIMDFWRMVSEHNVNTIVMLSELGEGKCPRYWDDGTAQYEHISVQYEESESCPYYTRRQFRVVNTKSGCVSAVRQLQYQGWPTAPGHVPEVTRGLAELCDAAAPRRAMLVHCHLGTERSALFVALCTLICQLRTERAVDVCNVTRKVRSQRQSTIDTFLHYEFLHRAILNYAELHNLLEDS